MRNFIISQNRFYIGKKHFCSKLYIEFKCGMPDLKDTKINA